MTSKDSSLPAFFPVIIEPTRRAEGAGHWLLAQKPFIVPIPGTKKVEHIRDNIGAADIRFTSEELADIRVRLEIIEVKGARYPVAS